MALWHGYGTVVELENERNIVDSSTAAGEVYDELGPLGSDKPTTGTVDGIDNISSTIAFEYMRESGLGGEKNFMALFLLVIPTMTVFGNLLVVASVYRERALRTATNYLIISMAMADLLVALCVMPFAVYVEVQNGLWKLPKSLCTCYTAIDVCASTASILNLVAISWDRYMAVSKPIEYAQSRQRKNRRVIAMILAVWCISIVIALPIVTGLNRLDDTPYCEFTNAVYIIASSFASFFLPCLIMVALYSVVLKKLRQRQEQRCRTNRNSKYASKKRGFSKRSVLSSFRRSMISNDRSTSNNDLSVVTGVSQCREAENDYNTAVKANSVQRRFENRVSNHDPLSESAFMMTQSPQIITSSTPLTAPLPPSPCCESVSRMSNNVKQRNGLKLDKDSGWSSHNNNNIIMTIATAEFGNRQNSAMLISDLTTDHVKTRNGPFDLLDVDESVPFIDASSAHATPLKRQKLSAQRMVSAYCNGTLKNMGNSISSLASVSPLVRASSLSAIEQVSSSKLQFTSAMVNTCIRNTSPLPRKRIIEDLNSRSRATSEPRRHSLAGFGMNPLSNLGFLFRDKGCFSEVLDVYRKRAATNGSTSAAAAARYSRQSGKERRATQTLAVVLVVFLCCWLPFFTCHMTNSVCMVLSGETCINIVAFFLTTWLGYMNSFMNPMIYTIFNPEYRRAFRNILCCLNSGHHR